MSKTVGDLRKEYEKAVKDGTDSFQIEGFEFLTAYAKYLLEFIDLKGIPDEAALKNVLFKSNPPLKHFRAIIRLDMKTSDLETFKRIIDILMQTEEYDIDVIYELDKNENASVVYEG